MTAVTPAQASYYQNHKEERVAYQAAYRASHPGCNAAYYQANGSALRERARGRYEELKEWLQILRTINGCEDCETHEGLLDFHHVDPSTKRFNISDMTNHSLDTLDDELEKCVVLCPPCHKKRHRELRSEPQFLSFVIDGKPQGKQRARMGKGGRWYTPKGTRIYEASVRDWFAYARSKAGGVNWRMTVNGVVTISVACYFPDARRRDIDNVLKAVMDGLNGAAYIDDSQVTSATVTKAIDRERPRTEVTVTYA